jgi:glutamate formiminotransferase
VGVRALGFPLASRQVAQVSMNLIALERTGLETACAAVRNHARAGGSDVTKVELVGLLPATELERCSEEFREWSGISATSTIEARVAGAARNDGPGAAAGA